MTRPDQIRAIRMGGWYLAWAPIPRRPWGLHTYTGVLIRRSDDPQALIAWAESIKTQVPVREARLSA